MMETKSPYSVLIVEDNETVLAMMNECITAYGYKAYTAKNACEGLRLHSMHRDIKVVLADLHMPEMSGREMAIIMIEREPRTIVYAITGKAEKFSLDDCLRVGFKDYFVKPMDLNHLRRLLEYNINRIRRWEKIK